MSTETIKIAGMAVIGLWLIVQVLLFWCKKKKLLSSDLVTKYALGSTVVFLGGFATSMMMMD